MGRLVIARFGAVAVLDVVLDAVVGLPPAVFATGFPATDVCAAIVFVADFFATVFFATAFFATDALPVAAWLADVPTPAGFPVTAFLVAVALAAFLAAALLAGDLRVAAALKAVFFGAGVFGVVFWAAAFFAAAFFTAAFFTAAFFTAAFFTAAFLTPACLPADGAAVRRVAAAVLPCPAAFLAVFCLAVSAGAVPDFADFAAFALLCVFFFAMSPPMSWNHDQRITVGDIRLQR